MKYNEFYFQDANFYFVIGFQGSGKTHVINTISYYFDLKKKDSKCPCIFDNVRQIYIFGRFLEFHGKSKTNINDGTDRMFPGVDTSRFISFIRKLVHDKSNILICEGISSVLCNISVLKQIQMIGYKLHIIELNTPLDECIHNLIRRNDYTIKTKKMIRAWKKKRIEIQDSFIVYQLSQEEAKIFLLDSVNCNSEIPLTLS